jgi:hypothetical protein
MSQPRNCGLRMIGTATMMRLAVRGRHEVCRKACLTRFAEDGKL